MARWKLCQSIGTLESHLIMWKWLWRGNVTHIYTCLHLSDWRKREPFTSKLGKSFQKKEKWNQRLAKSKRRQLSFCGRNNCREEWRWRRCCKWRQEKRKWSRPGICWPKLTNEQCLLVDGCTSWKKRVFSGLVHGYICLRVYLVSGSFVVCNKDWKPGFLGWLPLSEW